MIKTITDKSEYSLFPKLETQIESYNTPIVLFGKKWLIQDDYWMKHVHVKVTDACNAKCSFCIEKDSCIKTDWESLCSNLDSLLKQMQEQGHLTTVSITGGEPTLFPEHVSRVIHIIKNRGADFVSMNTNATNIFPAMGELDFIDISRHVPGYDYVCNIGVLDFGRILKFKAEHPNTKVRIQCVLHKDGIKSIREFEEFVKYYSVVADDISIRRLISIDNHIPSDDLFTQIKRYMYENAELVEQVLKDYYVYETWRFMGTHITFSHSNMKLLKDMEKVEPENILREIVVHPDGLISGSWYRNTKIIK